MASVAVLMVAAFAALGVAWYWRGLVFFPATLAAFGFLQAHRNTCVRRATEGTFEHQDLSKTTAAADEVAASRRVAAGINRDAVLLGVVSAVVAMAVTMVH
ncbi:MAG TPA: hypothetical protein VFH73_27190 [Polyangia bacterium]|jgi:hypothetical protein|nr:hypothetical protein [Polyangia bacterium]